MRVARGFAGRSVLHRPQTRPPGTGSRDCSPAANAGLLREPPEKGTSSSLVCNEYTARFYCWMEDVRIRRGWFLARVVQILSSAPHCRTNNSSDTHRPGPGAATSCRAFPGRLNNAPILNPPPHARTLDVKSRLSRHHKMI